MISWIQRSFQHHFRAIFFVLLAVTIVSFIVTIGATPGVGRADRQVVVHDFFGYNLGSQSDVQRMIGDARISADLESGYSGLTEDQIRDYAYRRVAALYLADTLHLPPASSSDLVGFIQGLPAFAGPNGQFDPARYASFRDSVRLGGGVSEGDITRVMLDDMRMDRVQRILDGPGYVLPGDVKDELDRSDTRWTLGVVAVDYASYRPAIEPTEQQIAKYYQDNSFRYQIPPRVSADYIEFPASEYLSGVSVTEPEIRAFYDANPAAYQPKTPAAKAGAPKIAPPSPDAVYAAAHARVEEDLKLERARNAAAKDASDLAVELYNDKVAEGPALDAVLASRKLTAKPLAPFTHDAGPAELGGSPEISDAAFQLNAGRYFSDALEIPKGAVLLLWKETLPVRQPPLAEVRSKVVADYIENERREDFIAFGSTLRSQLQAALKAGEPLAKAVSEAEARDSVKITYSTPASFTLSQPPADLSDSVSGALEHLDKGQISDMVATADTGYLVYAQDKKPPVLDPAKNPRVLQIRSELAAASARFSAAAYLTQMVADELKRSGTDANVN
jgi:peptidyl-prolyl cis-trans isomerase D